MEKKEQIRSIIQIKSIIIINNQTNKAIFLQILKNLSLEGLILT